MAKKKNISKKHRFKHVEQAGEQIPPASGAVEPGDASVGRPAAVSSGRVVANGTTVRDFSYVSGDVRRIGVMALVLVALELVLYYLLVHTSLGAAVYQLVKV